LGRNEGVTVPGVRLEWDGKAAEIPRLRLPLQVVETVNAPRADRGTLFGTPEVAAAGAWRNRLIWGDNLHVLASLAQELAGQVDLIYIDSPFDSRQDYKVRIEVGDGGDAAEQDLAKISSVVEEKAYRDPASGGPGRSKLRRGAEPRPAEARCAERGRRSPERGGAPRRRVGWQPQQ